MFFRKIAFLDSCYLLKIPDDGGLGSLELFPDTTLSNCLNRNRKLVAQITIFVFLRTLGNRKGLIVVSVFEIWDGPIEGELEHNSK